MTSLHLDENPQVLVVDDEPLVLQAWRRTLAGRFRAALFLDPAAAVQFVASSDVELDVAVLDVRMPGMDGLTMMRLLQAADPDLEVVFVSGYCKVSVAVDAMQQGAYYFLEKPIEDLDHALQVIAGAAARSRARRSSSRPVSFVDDDPLLHGSGRAIREVRDQVALIAASTLPVLVLGEPGAGKSQITRAIHQRSPRAPGPFLSMSCAGATGAERQIELFGSALRTGLLEAAAGGSVVLDDIEVLPRSAQVRLARVLAEGKVVPVGTAVPRPVDVRVMVTSTVDLDRLGKKEHFSPRLRDCLSTFQLVVPPLRDRRGDLMGLAIMFLSDHRRRLGLEPVDLDVEVIDALAGHTWPGNLAELERAMAHAAAMAQGSAVTLEDLPAGTTWRADRHRRQRDELMGGATLASAPFSSTRTIILDDFERRYLQDLLSQAEGNLSEASRRSGLDRTNLRRMMRRWNLVADAFRPR